MATPQGTLQVLPVAVHHATAARQDQTDAARFEAVVDVTDAAVVSSMHARRTASSWSAEQASQPRAETLDALAAVLSAVAAVTNTNSVPPPHTSKRELVRWTVATITEWRKITTMKAAVATAADTSLSDPAACMELVHRLNAHLRGAAPS